MQNRQIAHVWLGITLEQPHMYDRLAEHSHTAQTSEAVCQSKTVNCLYSLFRLV